MKTYIIAEVGSAWRVGKVAHHVDKACKAIAIAKAAGANACKFQWTSNPCAMERRRHAPVGSYEILAWPESWIRRFAAECTSQGIEFMCTVFLPQDIAAIAPYVKRFKVASLEAFDLELWDALEVHKKPIIMSTGALTQRDIDRIDSQIECVAVPITLLQCTAAYPAPLASLNLNAINRFISGLSDHSANVLTGAVAVGCGAGVIEVHFRLDETRKDNPDYPHSLSPALLHQYIANVRQAEAMCGDGIKKIEECECALLPHRVGI